ncbi:hypothetical protein CYLTODRAFT_84259 [Cylindrobasidium torrendii FP15055 ss-10]|uniref:Uncharacterized protein n=1 Tax=Cylindrobasidium torrendii FP15055 ss-10 TaxID=1314674 RepID=A0A0D7B3P9_9AGAR|nr:hypothetical protein CYLTODRAFT_84259 [Cylindrobasidium torrendii FP15055 ss-10]
MTANATTQAISFGSASPWISGNFTTPGASSTGEYNAPIPPVSPTTHASLSPSYASVPTPGPLQSPQPLYESPSVRRVRGSWKRTRDYAKRTRKGASIATTYAKNSGKSEQRTTYCARNRRLTWP